MCPGPRMTFNAVVGIVLLMTAASELRAGVPCEAFELERLDAPEVGLGLGTGFGWSVSFEGDVAVVGARIDDESCPNAGEADCGAAYVYRRGDNGTPANLSDDFWDLEQKIVVGDVAPGDWFGNSVSLSQDVIVVGVPRDDLDCPMGTVCVDAGSVFVFRRISNPISCTIDADCNIAGLTTCVAGSCEPWVKEQKLVAPDPTLSGSMGWSSEILDDVIVVGAPNSFTTTGIRSGVAFVFRHVAGNWVIEDTLEPDDAVIFDGFGGSVSIDLDVIVVGAGSADDAGELSGSAYVYQYDAMSARPWDDQEIELHPSDAAQDSWFGIRVDNREETIIIGAGKVDDACPGDITCDSGAAYVFEYDTMSGTWGEQQKLVPTDTARDDGFGWDVHLDGNLALIGASLDEQPCPPGADCKAGSVYVWQYDPMSGAWSEQAKLIAEVGEFRPGFGLGIDVSGHTAIVGAPHFATGTLAAVYFYGGLSDCNGNAALDLCDITDEISQDCNGNGLPDECDAISGPSLDCNSNLVPDECEPDCNDNAIADDCDIAADPLLDCDTNGQIDDCEATVFLWEGPDGGSYLQGAFWDRGTVPGAGEVARLINFGAGDNTCLLDAGASVSACSVLLESSGGFQQSLQLQPASQLAIDSVYIMGDSVLDMNNAVLNGSAEISAAGALIGSGSVSANVINDGLVESRTSNPGLTVFGVLDNRAGGVLRATFNAELDLASMVPVVQEGQVEALDNADIEFESELTNTASGTIILAAGSGFTVHGDLVNENLIHILDAQLSADNDIINNNEICCDGTGGEICSFSANALQISTGAAVNIAPGVGAFLNGSLLLPGGGVNWGTACTSRSLSGSTVDSTVTITGNLQADASAFLLAAYGILQLAGAFDVAIDQPERYDLSGVTLQLIGFGGEPQQVEVLSPDIGTAVEPSAAHFLVDSLIVGPTPTTVNLVDNHANAATRGAVANALYVVELIIHAGATLNTNGLNVYYGNLTLDGTVDDPDRLTKFTCFPYGDIDYSGVVDVDDILLVLDDFRGVATPAGVGDIDPCGGGIGPDGVNGDGDTDVDDIIPVLDAFSGIATCSNPCPP